MSPHAAQHTPHAAHTTRSPRHNTFQPTQLAATVGGRGGPPTGFRRPLWDEGISLEHVDSTRSSSVGITLSSPVLDLAGMPVGTPATHTRAHTP